MTDQLDRLIEDQEETLDFEYLGKSFKMRKKFKRLKFLRLLNNDPTAALALAFGPDEYERIEDLDMTDTEFSDFLSAFAERFTGSGGNSSASPS